MKTFKDIILWTATGIKIGYHFSILKVNAQLAHQVRFQTMLTILKVILRSEIKEIGVLDPNSIDNSNLIDIDESIKPNLYPEKDYVAIHPEIWAFIWEKYGGGPIIKRIDQDIYSDPLPTEDEENMFNNVRIKNCMPDKNLII